MLHKNGLRSHCVKCLLAISCSQHGVSVSLLLGRLMLGLRLGFGQMCIYRACLVLPLVTADAVVNVLYSFFYDGKNVGMWHIGTSVK